MSDLSRINDYSDDDDYVDDDLEDSESGNHD